MSRPSLNKTDTFNALTRPLPISNVNNLLKNHFATMKVNYQENHMSKNLKLFLGDGCTVVSCEMDYSSNKFLVKIMYEGKKYILDYDPI